MTDNSQKQTNRNESGASERKLWLRLDFVVIFIFLVIAIAFYVISIVISRTDGNLACEIVLDGEVKMTVGLSEDRTFSLEGLPNVVFEIKDGAVAFVRSDCPDKVCVLSGYQHQAGQMAVCLPNHVAIRISGGGIDAPDIVV